MTRNERIAEFAAELIERGRNPILAVFDAMAALVPSLQKRELVVHCASHQEPSPRDISSRSTE